MTAGDWLRNAMLAAGYQLYETAMDDTQGVRDTMRSYRERVDAIVAELGPDLEAQPALPVEPQEDMRWRAAVHVIQQAVADAVFRADEYAAMIAGPLDELHDTDQMAMAKQAWDALPEDQQHSIMGDATVDPLHIGVSARWLIWPESKLDEDVDR